MNRDKALKIIFIIVLLFTVAFVIFLAYKNRETTKELSNSNSIEVNLTKLTYLENKKSDSIKTDSQDDFDNFKKDYEEGTLPSIYITEFLFDGVSMYKPYDLDDFKESGNDYKVEALNIKNLNINTTKVVELTGEIKGGMISINTNDLEDDITILLNNVKIDTDSKKVPAIYVYNKDITYDKHKVTIKTVNETINYIEGGKLKKVSLIPSDDLDSYEGYYDSDYSNYSNYYGVYTNEEINKILFAKVQADREDLEDSDPYFYYKASGAISSDIDLYFEGKGYLEVNSKNQEGIETKGNLSLIGGTGNYVVKAFDDCLNTTTDKSENSNARNTITIDVHGLEAIVSEEADEGDAIDSNGKLIINGGRILAIAKSGSDTGIDSEDGTYINGGEVLATGDMFDEIKEDSKQNYIVLSFNNKPKENTLVTLLDKDDKNIFAYKTDRTYSYLVYSSSDLVSGSYSLYKDGELDGESDNGFYSYIKSYNKGTLLGYSSTNIGGGRGNPMDDRMTPPDDGMGPNDDMSNRDDEFDYTEEAYTTNKEFKIDGIKNTYGGIAPYGEL